MAKDHGAGTNEIAWTRAAQKVAQRINLGWWLQYLSIPLVIIGLLGTCGLLLIRHATPDTPVWALGAGVAGALGLISGITLLVAKRRFESRESSLVRIEDSMKLRNGLSAAKAGVAPWPQMPERVSAGLVWDWKRVVIPPLAALALLLAGLFIPVAALANAGDSPTEEPLAWKQVEADLDRLEQEEMIDEAYMEELKKKIEELREKPEEEWFSHSSLEASDSLKEQHQSELKEFQRNTERADRALGNLTKNMEGMPQAQKDQLMNQFDQALQGLQNGALKPNQELLNQLQQLDPKNLGQLNGEQLEQLRENLQKAGQACKDCQGGGQGDEWLDELLGDGDGNGSGQGNQNGPDGNGPDQNWPGNGGVNRGPGHAPGVLGQESDPLKTGDLEALEAKDLSRSLPGDLLQVQDGEHSVDESPTQSQGGGNIQGTGQGGDRVWRESLDPDEQRALKRFFE